MSRVSENSFFVFSTFGTSPFLRLANSVSSAFLAIVNSLNSLSVFSSTRSGIVLIHLVESSANLFLLHLRPSLFKIAGSAFLFKHIYDTSFPSDLLYSLSVRSQPFLGILSYLFKIAFSASIGHI